MSSSSFLNRPGFFSPSGRTTATTNNKTRTSFRQIGLFRRANYPNIIPLFCLSICHILFVTTFKLHSIINCAIIKCVCSFYYSYSH
jgi:hypothetical protein